MSKTITVDQIQLDDKVSLTLHGAVNGTTQINGVVISITSWNGIPVSSSAPTDHVNLYPLLPDVVKDTTPDSWTAYRYIGIKMADGTVQYVGYPWIVNSTAILDNPVVAIITLNDFNESSSESLKALLRVNGYSVDNIVLQ